VLKLTYSNLEFQNFPGEDPLFKGREGRRGRGREGRGRTGKGGEEREGTGEGGRAGMGWGGALDMGSASLETSSGSPLVASGLAAPPQDSTPPRPFGH